MQWKVPRIWEGGRCIVIGGGPSILRQFDVPNHVIQSVYSGQSSPVVYSPYLQPIHGEHVIGVNMAMKFGSWVDVLFFGDGGFWNRHRDDIMDFQGLRVTTSKKAHEAVPNNRRIKYLKVNSKVHGLCLQPTSLCWNLNSGAAAINLAVLFGVKQVILLGFDMKLDESVNQHWHKFYKSNPKTVKGTFKMHMKAFPAILEDAKPLGVEIINANPDSEIPDFRKVPIKELIKNK